MIRAILVVGWLGMALLVWASVTGHDTTAPVHGANLEAREQAAERHLVVALFPTTALLFADVCLLIYMPGTARVARRTARELDLGPEWGREQGRLARRGVTLAIAAGAVTAVLFGSGYRTYAAVWPGWVHLTLTIAAALLQLAVLLVGGRALLAGEARLKALGREVERLGSERDRAAILPAPP